MAATRFNLTNPDSQLLCYKCTAMHANWPVEPLVPGGEVDKEMAGEWNMGRPPPAGDFLDGS